MNKKWLFGLVLIFILGAAASYVISLYFKHYQLQDLVQRTRDRLIYVEGGTFSSGNYQTGYRQQDGSVEIRWVKEPELTLPPHKGTLKSYYLQDRETTNADFSLYLKAQGWPAVKLNREYDKGVPDKAVNLAWHEAEAYCTWLGELTGIPLRLPLEAEWEFAARSRIFSPPWATNNGEFRKGVNVRPASYDDPNKNPPVATFPPNPLGFYNMADGLYEWVSDKASTDPDNVKIAKGSSNFSSGLFEPIASRYPVSGRESFISRLYEKVRLMRNSPALIHYASATARCAASVSEPPIKTGFGQLPDLKSISLPDAFGPYRFTRFQPVVPQ